MKNHQKDKPSMIVEINGEEVCTAGICGDGHLSASITPMNLKTQKGEILKNINCHVMGIFDKEIYTWYYDEKRLKVGDEVTIKIVQLDDVDDPIEISPVDDLLLNPPWWKFWKKK